MTVHVVIHFHWYESAENICGVFKTREGAVRAIGLMIDEMKGECEYIYDGYDRWGCDSRQMSFSIDEKKLEE